jgi:hypothetical protein
MARDIYCRQDIANVLRSVLSVVENTEPHEMPFTTGARAVAFGVALAFDIDLGDVLAAPDVIEGVYGLQENDGRTGGTVPQG